MVDYSSKIIVTIDVELEDLIPGFLKSREKDIEKVKEYLAASDFEAIRLLGHTMKGNGAGYGFDDLSVVGREMEQAAIEEAPDAINKTLDDLSAYLENVEVVFE